MTKETIQATMICLSVLRVFQSVEQIARHKSAVKIVNAISKRIASFAKKDPLKVELCYRFETAYTQQAEQSSKDITIEPVAFICHLLRINKDLIDKYFKINWNHVDKLENLRWINKASKLSIIKNSFNHSRILSNIILEQEKFELK